MRVDEPEDGEKVEPLVPVTALEVVGEDPSHVDWWCGVVWCALQCDHFDRLVLQVLCIHSCSTNHLHVVHRQSRPLTRSLTHTPTTFPL